MRFSLPRPIGPSAHRPIGPSAHRPSRLVLSLAALGLAALALGSLSARPASAQATIKLYNTGVNSNGTVAALGTVDQHYRQVSPTAAPTYLYNDGRYMQLTQSQYISVDASGGPGGSYTVDFRTTFDLTGLNPATALISGNWLTDNLGNDILINGHSTGLTSPGFQSFTHFDLSPFAADFQSGLNTLDFVWTNQGDVGSLDVQGLQGTAAPVPEASTTVSLGLLLALGMGGLVVAGRRRKA